MPKHSRTSLSATSIGKASAGRDNTIHIDNSTTTVTNTGTAAAPVLVTESGLMVVGRIPRRAPHFVDRAQVRQLQQALRQSPVAVVVCGMRGAGKTQVAAAHARDVIAAGGPGLVAWVNAETLDTLLAGLGEIAARVGVADPEGDSEASAHRLRDHLSERGEPALLVLDNATDPDRVDAFLPTGGVTRVVVTSTDRAFTGFGVLIEAGQGFARRESVRYLGEATGLDDTVGADLVADDLGDLPLALSAAATTITGRRLDYPRYRQLLADQRLSAVLPRTRGSDHPLATDEALLLAVQTVETTAETELDTVVQWLLGVMAMLSPDGVARVMLPDRDGWVGAALQRCVEGSLLSWSVTGDVVVMHRLVARVLRERAYATSTLDRLAIEASAVIEQSLFDESEAFQRREDGSRLVDHIEALWNTIHHANSDTTSMVLALRRWASRQLIAAADTTRSITQAHHTHTDHIQIFGPDHPDTLASRNNLAYAYRLVGRLTDAISLYEQTLADQQRILGPDHPDTLASRSNLAGAYESAGRLGDAIPLYEQTLTDSQRVRGGDHPSTLISRNNLAYTYESAGRLTDAIPLFEQTLTDSQRVLGPDHPSTLTSRNNLAGAYQSAGRLGDAIPLYEQTLTDSQRVRGGDHPSTLASRNNLAGAYRLAGKVAEAISMYEQTLADQIQILGPDHPDTLTSRSNLAYAYQSAGRLTDAISMYEQTLADRQRILGPDHPHTLISRSNLAHVYLSAGRLTDAISMYEQTLADCMRVLGSDHPITAVVRGNLAAAWQ
ncbi:tetratricopeptide repeat protein [Nocardia abscessus]|uniref:tetratricopeptide repeat protein n=1 Tax=Nocardia abscessus TaxID=120957 RepID=UPI0024583247|nr:tetratricopeptide repeat protein [Nocardia abscessus]